MIKKLFFAYILLLLSCENSRSQTFKSLILGKWENYKRETVNGIETNALGKIFNADYRWEFLVDGFLDHLSERESMPSTFVITDSTLIIGKVKYKIEKLTKDQLVIVYIDPILNHSTPGDKRDYFNKVDKFNFNK